MKRIEAFFEFGRLEAVVEAVERAGAQGITVIYARGRGAAERLPLHTNRGTVMQKPLFNIIDGIVTVVDDHLVEPIVEAIKKHTVVGSKGIVIVSDVNKVVKL
ncbi:MAG: P-II family nitrogen regulator [Nitrososphaera sp.]|jgi:nitrogen regulatory protein PII